MDKICLVTRNTHKAEEISAMLGEHELSVLDLNDIGYHDDIEEPFHTLYENAHIKAATIHKSYQIATLADDSGLFVEALNGQPGVRSARYAGDQATDEDNWQLLLRNMEGHVNRKAFFCTVVCFIHEGVAQFFEGKVHGTISKSSIGFEGFGYDPIFIPEASTKSFAQMTPQEKNSQSHRRKAIQLWLDYLKAQV